MIKVIVQPDLEYVNRLIALIQTSSLGPDGKFKCVNARLSTQGLVLSESNGPKKCIVVIFSACTVDYTFATKRGVQGKRHTTTVDDIDVTANAIIQYFDKEELPDV